MKKIVLFYLLLLGGLLVNGQEFSFRMYFEDSAGNKDTLEIGYDMNGSRDSILAQFNEVNLVETPFNRELDVRITNQADINMGNYNHSLFHTKSKTIRYYCPIGGYWFTENPYVNIDILTENWPVTVTWDQDLFQDTCLSGSIITPLHPMTWWDSGMYFSDFERILMAEQDQLTFTGNFPSNWAEYPHDNVNFNYYVIEEFEYPISTFRFGFGDSTLIALKAESENSLVDLTVYPNPTTGRVFLKGSYTSPVEKVYAVDISGKMFELLWESEGTDISRLNSGLYLLNVVFSDGMVRAGIMVKN